MTPIRLLLRPVSHLLERADVKFLIVSGVGFIADLVLAWSIEFTSGLRLSLAAMISFFAVGIINYFLHETFTFKATASRFNASRLSGTILASVAALLCRLSVIEVGLAIGSGPILNVLWLLAGGMASLAVNFAVLRYFIFAGHR